MKTNLFCILTALMLALLPACTDNDAPQPTPFEETQIVTVLSNSAAEGFNFQFQRTLGSEIVTAHSEGSLDADLTPGMRLQVAYRALMADTARRPMPVTIAGAGYVAFDTIRAKTLAEIRSQGNPMLKTLSAWLTDDFVNVQALMNYSGEPRSFSILADLMSLQRDTVELYFVPRGMVEDRPFVDRRVCGSFYLRHQGEALRGKKLRLHTNESAILLH